MPVNKVVFGAVAIMDISDSTVTPETLKKGETAYDKTGEKITGTYEPPATENLTALLDEQESKLNTLLSTLDGKAGGSGGASVETCTLTLGKNGGANGTIYLRYPTIDVDGTVVMATTSVKSTLSRGGSVDVITLKNAVIVVDINGSSGLYSLYTDKLQNVEQFIRISTYAEVLKVGDADTAELWYW